jgi:NADH-quinone oxidoreductase subunit L
MPDPSPYLWLVPGLPLLAAVVTAFFGPRWLRRQSHWPCIIAIALSCALSLWVASAIATGGHDTTEPPVAGAQHDPRPFAVQAHYGPWIEAGSAQEGVHIGFTLRADALSGMMLVMITFIATFIAIYSVGYMHGERGYPRFFAEVALFVFMMTLLVLADNFILLYAGWEGVGLCSYLLIGFWFTKPAAANAARKAFLVTRIGDVGLILGIFLLWVTFGYRLDFQHVLLPGAVQSKDAVLMIGACLLLLAGACGKSAQFPLHVWLPDAMEGPTPVSALIHAATMVTAGVYLVARCTVLFANVDAAQLVVAVIGAFTALMAALVALTQTDLKRVLAYSTISQLGYMFLALGSAVPRAAQVPEPERYALVVFGVVAALFHLFTHAFFKALLFLSAGSVMHGMGHVIDMRRFSGLKRVMPVTHITFLCGALALAGFPLFSGFWSKDEILTTTWMAGHGDGYARVYLFLWGVGLLTAGITAFYTFRAYFLTFHGELRVPPEADAPHHNEDSPEHAGQHAPHAQPVHGQDHITTAPRAGAREHTLQPRLGPGGDSGGSPGRRASYESPPVMTVPLIVLSVFAVAIGLIVGPTYLFAHFIELGSATHSGEASLHWGLMAISSVVVLIGIGLAWLFYVVQPDLPKKLAKIIRDLYQMSLNKFYMDELYDVFVVRPLSGLAAFCRIIDNYLVDGIVDLVGHVPRLLGARFRPVQNGLVQFYALAMVLGLAVFLLALMRSL